MGSGIFLRVHEILHSYTECSLCPIGPLTSTHDNFFKLISLTHKWLNCYCALSSLPKSAPSLKYSSLCFEGPIPIPVISLLGLLLHGTWHIILRWRDQPGSQLTLNPPTAGLQFISESHRFYYSFQYIFAFTFDDDDWHIQLRTSHNRKLTALCYYVHHLINRTDWKIYIFNFFI